MAGVEVSHPPTQLLCRTIPSLARLVQTVSGKGRRYMFTFVAGQQQPYVQIMIEIVPPGFVKACAQQFSFPKMSGLGRSVSPRQTMRRRFGNHRAHNFGRASFTKHLGIAADPLSVRMLVKIFRHGRERSARGFKCHRSSLGLPGTRRPARPGREPAGSSRRQPRAVSS